MERRNRSWSSSCSPPATQLILLLLLSVLFLLSDSASASSFISDGVFGGDRGASTGRNLLQAKKACPVNFEFMNYTIITSKCKGPQYPPDVCCGAFKEIACPYVDEINDLTNDCATTMFSYINLYGKYPPGLFASECREGKEGLACDTSSPSQSANASSLGFMLGNPSPLLALALVLLVLLAQLF